MGDSTRVEVEEQKARQAVQGHKDSKNVPEAGCTAQERLPGMP
jgi:hypothetical protein